LREPCYKKMTFMKIELYYHAVLK